MVIIQPPPSSQEDVGETMEVETEATTKEVKKKRKNEKKMKKNKRSKKSKMIPEQPPEETPQTTSEVLKQLKRDHKSQTQLPTGPSEAATMSEAPPPVETLASSKLSMPSFPAKFLRTGRD